jgi:hypothetical protein
MFLDAAAKAAAGEEGEEGEESEERNITRGSKIGSRTSFRATLRVLLKRLGDVGLVLGYCIYPTANTVSELPLR